MSNMSYCRFENTDRDLADCEETLLRLTRLEDAPLSRSELDAATSLAERSLRIVLLLAEYVGADVGDLDHPSFGETIRSAVIAANEDALACEERDE